MRQAITEVVARKAGPPEKGQRTIWDTVLPNFGLRISQGGTRSWVLQHGANRQLITIGRYPVVSVGAARDAAKRLLAERTLGKVNPTRITFDDAKTAYLALCETKNRPRTVADYRRLLDRHFHFGKTRLADISPQEIARRIDKLKRAPSERHHAYVAARAFFTWATKRHYLDRNPFERLDAPPRNDSRSHVLTAEEIGEILSKARQEAFPYGPILVMLVCTGQRRGEIAALRWEWIDEAQRIITLPPFITKNGRPHAFPYGDLVQEVIADLPRLTDHLFPAARSHVRGKPTTVFNGWQKAKYDFDKKLEGVRPWAVHDLRRTFSTMLAEMRISPHIIERLLNHVSGTISGVVAVYNRYTYVDEMRAAISRYEEHLSALIAPE